MGQDRFLADRGAGWMRSAANGLSHMGHPFGHGLPGTRALGPSAPPQPIPCRRWDMRLVMGTDRMAGFGG